MALKNTTAQHYKENIEIKTKLINNQSVSTEQKQVIKQELDKLKEKHSKHVEAVVKNFDEQIKATSKEVKKKLEEAKAEFKSKYESAKVVAEKKVETSPQSAGKKVETNPQSAEKKVETSPQSAGKKGEAKSTAEKKVDLDQNSTENRSKCIEAFNVVKNDVWKAGKNQNNYKNVKGIDNKAAKASTDDKVKLLAEDKVQILTDYMANILTEDKVKLLTEDKVKLLKSYPCREEAELKELYNKFLQNINSYYVEDLDREKKSNVVKEISETIAAFEIEENNQQKTSININSNKLADASSKVKIYKDINADGINVIKLCAGDQGKLEYTGKWNAYMKQYAYYTYDNVSLTKDTAELYSDYSCETLAE